MTNDELMRAIEALDRKLSAKLDLLVTVPPTVEELAEAARAMKAGHEQNSADPATVLFECGSSHRWD